MPAFRSRRTRANSGSGSARMLQRASRFRRAVFDRSPTARRPTFPVERNESLFAGAPDADLALGLKETFMASGKKTANKACRDAEKVAEKAPKDTERVTATQKRADERTAAQKAKDEARLAAQKAREDARAAAQAAKEAEKAASKKKVIPLSSIAAT